MGTTVYLFILMVLITNTPVLANASTYDFEYFYDDEDWLRAIQLLSFDDPWVFETSNDTMLFSKPEGITDQWDVQEHWSDRVYTIPPGESFEVTDGISILGNFRLTYSEPDPNKVYFTYLELESNGERGWVDLRDNPIDMVSDFPGIMVRFNEPFYGLREGPSTASPIIVSEDILDSVTDSNIVTEWYLTPEIEEGQVFNLHAYLDGWLCVGTAIGGGWLPVDSAALTYFVNISGFLIYEEGGGRLYYPVGDEVSTLILKIGGSRLVLSNPGLSITTESGEVAAELIGVICEYHWAGSWVHIFECEKPIPKEDIVSIKYSFGVDDEISFNPNKILGE